MITCNAELDVHVLEVAHGSAFAVPTMMDAAVALGHMRTLHTFVALAELGHRTVRTPSLEVMLRAIATSPLASGALTQSMDVGFPVSPWVAS